MKFCSINLLLFVTGVSTSTSSSNDLAAAAATEMTSDHRQTTLKPFRFFLIEEHAIEPIKSNIPKKLFIKQAKSLVSQIPNVKTSHNLIHPSSSTVVVITTSSILSKLSTSMPVYTASKKPAMSSTNRPVLIPTSTSTNKNPTKFPFTTLPPSKALPVTPVKPSMTPSALKKPTLIPIYINSLKSTLKPSYFPSITPTLRPSFKPTSKPSYIPTTTPSVAPSIIPTFRPSVKPSGNPITLVPSTIPSILPSAPSNFPSSLPSPPTILPTLTPSSNPTYSHAPSTSSGVASNLDWYTAAYNNQRNSLNPYENKITTDTLKVAQIKRIWNFQTVGSVIAQPVTACNFTMPDGKRKCVAYFGDESGYFYAIDIANGKLEWKIFLGSTKLYCWDFPDNDVSISGTATFERFKNTIYVVGGAGSFNAIQMTTGNILWQIKNFYNPLVLHNYGGLLLQNNIVYVIFGSMCDKGSYIGTLYAVNIITHSVVAKFQPSYGKMIGGGMWGLAGPTLGDMSSPETSAIYQPTGNCMVKTAGTKETDYLCEKVVRLNMTTLTAISSLTPPKQNIIDNDFGSSATFFNGVNEPRIGGCMHPMITAFRKRGQMLVGTADTFESIQNITVCDSSDWKFIQQSTWDPDSNTLIVPAYLSYKLIAYSLLANCTLAQKWTANTKFEPFSVTMAGPAGIQYK